MTFDFSALPNPDFLTPTEFESLRTLLLDQFRERHPEYNHLTSADPAVKLIEVTAAQQVLSERRMNSAVRGLLLGTSAGVPLDWLAANDGVARLAGETDEQLRQRVILTKRSSSTAGTRPRYQLVAQGANPRVAAAQVISGNDGSVKIFILSRETEYLAGQSDSELLPPETGPDDSPVTFYGLTTTDTESVVDLRTRIQNIINAAGRPGTPTGKLLAAVAAAFTDRERSLNDTVVPIAITVRLLTVEAVLEPDRSVPSIPSLPEVEAAFRKAVANEGGILFGGVTTSWISARLCPVGIRSVKLEAPTTDVADAGQGVVIRLEAVNLRWG